MNESLLLLLHLVDPVSVEADLVTHGALIRVELVDGGGVQLDVTLQVCAPTLVEVYFLTLYFGVHLQIL